MSIESIELLIGAAALALALLGGNIKAKEVDVGPISGTARIGIGIFGICMILLPLGIWPMIGDATGLRDPRPEATPTATPSPTPSSSAVTPGALPPIATPTPDLSPTPTPTPTNDLERFANTDTTEPETPTVEEDYGRRRIRLEDGLGPSQIYENIRVKINGREALNFSLDKNQTSQAFTLTVQGGDTYELSGTSGFRFTDPNNVLRLYEYPVVGSGSFSADAARTNYVLSTKSHTAERLEIEIKSQ